MREKLFYEQKSKAKVIEVVKYVYYRSPFLNNLTCNYKGPE